MPCQRNIKMMLAYDGSDFFGWQIQPGKRTVQGVLEHSLERILGAPTPVIASGRTDTGVHALGQVVNFMCVVPIPLEGLQRALNASLPPDMAVRSLEGARADFHARRHVRSKQYAYWIDAAPQRSPLLARYALHVPDKLDIPAMNAGARALVGEHDFAAFMAAGSAVKTTVRRVDLSEVMVRGSNIYYVIEGSGFLRHMVRNIVGTLYQVGCGALSPDDLPRIMHSRDRSCAGPTAAPQGLYLVRVTYEGGIL